MRPYVRINFACSLDGKISQKNGIPFKFSNLEDLKRVHQLRASSDIILVGKNTINNDDPKLVVNDKYFKSSHIPDVAVLDSRVEVRKESRIFSYQRKVVIICGKKGDVKKLKDHFESEIIIRKCDTDSPTIECALNHLYILGYRNVMVEGGRAVLTSFLRENAWDEITIFFSPYLVGEEGTPMFGEFEQIMKLNSIRIKELGNGFLVNIKKEF
jgi:riboflavin-specific deaminase-like protein